MPTGVPKKLQEARDEAAQRYTEARELSKTNGKLLDENRRLLDVQMQQEQMIEALRRDLNGSVGAIEKLRIDLDKARSEPKGAITTTHYPAGYVIKDNFAEASVKMLEWAGSPVEARIELLKAAVKVEPGIVNDQRVRRFVSEHAMPLLVALGALGTRR